MRLLNNLTFNFNSKKIDILFCFSEYYLEDVIQMLNFVPPLPEKKKKRDDVDDDEEVII